MRALAQFDPNLAAEERFFSWPGLGSEPADAAVRGLPDLVRLVLAEMDQPVNLVAQSMGGLVALKAALAAPDRVLRMVLVATSAGLTMSRFGAADWRSAYFKTYPKAASWIGESQEDLSKALPSIEAPTLLIWGSEDPISPVAVGEKLEQLLPHAILKVVAGGDHDLARTHAERVAALIASHFADVPAAPGESRPQRN
jgi:pimeloyl-ACP methyl ester carboxylesterase